MPVRSCIHHDRAAKRRGDPRGKLQTGETFGGCGAREMWKPGAGLGNQTRVLEREPVEPLTDLDDDTTNAAVGDEDVATLPDDLEWNAVLEQPVGDLPQLIRGSRKDEDVCGAADAE